MDIQKVIEDASEQVCRDALLFLLGKYLSPAFGSLPKREIDLLVFETLEILGFIEPDPTIYSLVQRLRVTSSKARNLLYDRELRRLSIEDLEEKVKEALKHPVIQKQGELFVLQIENPLVIDHLRSKMRMLGHATDGSFSPNLVKLSGDAVVSLLDSFLTQEEREKAKQIFVSAEILPNKSWKGMLKGVLIVLGRIAADEAGAALVKNVMGPLIDGAFEQVAQMVGDLFVNENTA